MQEETDKEWVYVHGVDVSNGGTNCGNIYNLAHFSEETLPIQGADRLIKIDRERGGTKETPEFKSSLNY